MTITLEARHHWELAIFLAWLPILAGTLVPFLLLARRKGNKITRSETLRYRFIMSSILFVASLLIAGAYNLLDRIPVRAPAPSVATPQETAAAASAAAERLRLAKGRTLKMGDTVRIVWGHGAAGVVAGGNRPPIRSSARGPRRPPWLPFGVRTPAASTTSRAAPKPCS